MFASRTPQPRLALQEVDSNAGDDMDVDVPVTAEKTKHAKHSKKASYRPQGENEPLALATPDPFLSDSALQQALLHSPQFEGSPTTIFKLKLAHLGFVEGSPPDGKLQPQMKASCFTSLIIFAGSMHHHAI